MPEQLEKVMDYKMILIITINSIMGTGIFFLPAIGAANAGPASLISWFIMSLVAIYISMCFAELTSMFPQEGGIYEFCKQAFGRFWSFIVGWMTIIAANVTIAMLVVGAIQYLLPFHGLLHIQIPIALFFIFAFNYIAYRGMQTSAFMLVTFGIITLATLFLLIIPGLFHTKTANLTPFFAFPIPAILFTVFLISETFFGWETATFLAAETKDGEKVMPRALITGTIIISLICLLFVFTSVGSVPWRVFGQQSAPLSALANLYYGFAGNRVFTILVYLSIIGSVAGWIVSAPRLLLSMARDKLFPSQLAEIHPTFKTPHKAILFQTGLTTLLVIAGAGSYETLLKLLIPLVLVMYSAVLLSLVVLRRKMPHRQRYYTTPFGTVGPLFIIAILAGLVITWLIHEPGSFQLLRMAISLIILGIPIFFLLEAYYDPRMIVRVNNLLARISLWTESINLPVRVRKELAKIIGDVKNKHILEYGSGVGTLTIVIAKSVLPNGRIVATNDAKHELHIAKDRVKKKGFDHVTLLLTKPNQLHKDIKKVDMVVSAGKIGYVQNEIKFLKEISRVLRKNGRVVFLEYDHFFKFLPNVSWLGDNNNIRKVFKKAGLSVKVVRKKGLLWEYIYIYGKKSA